MCFLAAIAVGQTAAPTPKKNPFEGWGTSLDKRPSGHSSVPPMGPSGLSDSHLSPSVPAPSTPPPPPAATTAGQGLVLSTDWASHLSEANGGHSLELQDIKTLLSRYGHPEADLGNHPEVKVYPGIRYLMPVAEVEATLFKDARRLSSPSKIACPGFPSGLFFISYDVKSGIYNRMYLVVDRANQVVSLELVAEDTLFVPPSPPFRRFDGAWHVYDYVNDRIKGQPDIVIDTRVRDARSPDGYVVVNTTGGRWPDPIGDPGIIRKPPPANVKPKQASTWFVPVPLVNLILYCAREAAGR